MNFESSNFSVIIQGPILGKYDDPIEKQLTNNCIKSIRNILPNSEIIISTWLGSDVGHIDGYDIIIFNIDPGAITYNDFELSQTFNNNNRQIVSTRNGLKSATKEYSIKIRPDFELQNLSFLNYFLKYDKIRKFPFFKSRILVTSLGSRDPRNVPLLFAISDLFQIGRTSDLINLWDIPLQPEPETTRAFPYGKFFINDPFRHHQYKMRFSSEQYIWYAFSKKNGLDLDLKYFCEIPIKYIAYSIISITDNFVILNSNQLGIKPPERLCHSYDSIITFEKWEILYNKICISKSVSFILSFVIRVVLVSLIFSLINIKKEILDNTKQFIKFFLKNLRISNIGAY